MRLFNKSKEKQKVSMIWLITYIQVRPKHPLSNLW